MGNLVFRSAVAKSYLDKFEGLQELKKRYRKALGLPQKIEKFLFPIIRKYSLNQVQSDLRNLIPSIYNRRREDGVYDLRSKVVHEGFPIGKEEAEHAIKTAFHFLEILRLINDSIRSK